MEFNSYPTFLAGWGRGANDFDPEKLAPSILPTLYNKMLRRWWEKFCALKWLALLTSECHKCFQTSQALCRVIVLCSRTTKTKAAGKHSYQTPFLEGTPGISETELSPHCLYGKRKERFHLPEMEFNSYPTFLEGRRTLILKRCPHPHILPPPHRKNFTPLVGRTLYPKCAQQKQKPSGKSSYETPFLEGTPGAQQKQKPSGKHSYETPFLKGTPGISETELSHHCLYGKRKEKFRLPEMEFNSYPTFLGGGGGAKNFDPEKVASHPHHSNAPPLNFTPLVGRTLYPKCNSSSRVEAKSESIVCRGELA
ncbi:hypothetical protein CDAR_491591 [Caerostris darwini]|uniref:Uncharacterized protein n=1 Tax=Caerostris darwini TaxID=1538125 RepID=A0AAV4X8Q6_9ARAC|nr:hypothetical protein CDAR_491591 [Caerostris darwini]